MTRQMTATETILRAAQRIDAVVADRAREFGITPRQIDIILMLADEPGLSQVEMMQRCTMDRSTLSAVVRLLIKDGYVRQRQRKSDCRANDTFLTKAGDELVAVARHIREEMDRQIGDIIKAPGHSALLKLRSVVKSLEAA